MHHRATRDHASKTDAQPKFYSGKMDSLASVTVSSDFDTEAVKAMLADQLDKKLVALGTEENPAMSFQDIYGCSKDFVQFPDLLLSPAQPHIPIFPEPLYPALPKR